MTINNAKFGRYRKRIYCSENWETRQDEIRWRGKQAKIDIFVNFEEKIDRIVDIELARKRIKREKYLAKKEAYWLIG